MRPPAPMISPYEAIPTFATWGLRLIDGVIKERVCARFDRKHFNAVHDWADMLA